MTQPSRTDRSQAFHRHLHDNEGICGRQNIIVRVDSINTAHSVAYCTVEQRYSGLFRRSRSNGELVWRAEQALAPLAGLGLVTLITVRNDQHPLNMSQSVRKGSIAALSCLLSFWRWLGHPLAHAGADTHPRIHDPFGWQQAMMASAVR